MLEKTGRRRPGRTRGREMEEYERKRDFARTPEPKARRRRPSKAPIFVIQKHAASRLHYDLRFEVDGVLKSWAVPKGPSTDPQVKRLAMPTEDHPMAYADFEGVIPQGEYGGGAVMVWDRGTYENVTERRGKPVPAAEAIAAGHFRVRLHGQKISGGYALQRTGDGPRPRWLLIKTRDESASARRNPVSTKPRSVLSDRTIKQIEREEGGG